MTLLVSMSNSLKKKGCSLQSVYYVENKRAVNRGLLCDNQ
jgi:hypothetical protein